MSSPAGIPANRFQEQDSGKEKTMSDIYGHLYGMPFARWDHDTQSWRTCEATSLLDLPMFLEILPTSGSMRNGQLSQQPTLERPIEGNDYSSLPTPHAGLGERGRDGVILNPKGQQDLQHAIAHLLPTPTVNDMGAGKDPQKWQEWTEQMRHKHGNGNGHGRSLEQEALSIGHSTSQPSGTGNTPSDDQHQNLPLWEQQDDLG
jgi:hypothetical protein